MVKWRCDLMDSSGITSQLFETRKEAIEFALQEVETAKNLRNGDVPTFAIRAQVQGQENTL